MISGILPLTHLRGREGGGGGVFVGGIGGVLRGLFCENTRAGTGRGISLLLSSDIGSQKFLQTHEFLLL